MKNTKINILIVEDNFFIADDLAVLIENMSYNVVDKVPSYEEAVEALKNNTVDLIFIDINLSTKKTGIDLANFINKTYKRPFIFLTANSDEETLSLATKTLPYSYLVKPFEPNNIKASIELAISKFNNNQTKPEKGRDFMFIKNKDVYQKVLFKNILYVKSDNVYLEIYTDDKMYLLRSTLKGFLEKLPSYFYKCNKSYIVNINSVEKFTVSHLILKNEKILISKEFKPIIKNLFM